MKTTTTKKNKKNKKIKKKKKYSIRKNTTTKQNKSSNQAENDHCQCFHDITSSNDITSEPWFSASVVELEHVYHSIGIASAAK